MKDVTVEQQETDLLHSQYQALLEISEAIASHRDLEQLFHDLAPRLHRVVQFDFANLILYESAHKVMKSHVWKRRILLTVVLLARVLWRRRGTGSVRRRNLGWPLILALTRGSRMWRDGFAIVGSCHSASFPLRPR